ncbi:class I SAM-dependent methyltransferase [Mucisphaera sp.]|uniref:class I SAM-dependent methyltransferase n=1 Tax=Mucisphaera sp. TaxID=2913024 RepID=UPI003D124F74
MGGVNEPALPRLYGDLSELWPKLSPAEDYGPEAAIIRGLIGRTFGAGSKRVLELGAGGGHTLYHLKRGHRCVASDLSASMLAACRALNPEVETIVADMRGVRLERVFDVVLIHDAIDYLLTEADLLATFRSAGEHLEPGGLLITAPDNTAETFDASERATDEREEEGRVYRLTSTVSELDERFNYGMLLEIEVEDLETGERRTYRDEHRCAAFPLATWLRLFEEAGFEAELAETELPWSLFTAVKR